MYTWQKVNHALCSTLCQFYLNFIDLLIESLLRNFKCKFLLIVIYRCPKRAYALELWNECQVSFHDWFYYKQECKLQEWKFTHNYLYRGNRQELLDSLKSMSTITNHQKWTQNVLILCQNCTCTCYNCSCN